MTTDTEAVVRDIRARDIDARIRHETILGALDQLAPGQAVRLIVDHDPKPLFHMLQAEHGGEFDWLPEQAGPDEWRIVVRRLASDGCSAVTAYREDSHAHACKASTEH